MEGRSGSEDGASSTAVRRRRRRGLNRPSPRGQCESTWGTMGRRVGEEGIVRVLGYTPHSAVLQLNSADGRRSALYCLLQLGIATWRSLTACLHPRGALGLRTAPKFIRNPFAENKKRHPAAALRGA
jgi:hypothetical protein